MAVPLSVSPDAIVLTIGLVAGSLAIRSVGADVPKLARFCKCKGMAYEFALSAAYAVLFASGARAAWDVAHAMISSATS